MSRTYIHSFPKELVSHVTAICGQRGLEWLDRLPALIADLELKWGVTVDVPFEKGEYNFVAPAYSPNGLDAVLKIAPPYERTEIFAEAAFLRSRAGDGCVRLLDEDRERFAILIERARPGLSMDEHFEANPFACVDPAVEVLRSLLTLSPVDPADVQHLDDWFDRFRRFRETDFPQDYGEKALAIHERLRQQHRRIFYLHGDFHPGNIVTSDRTPFLAIDPKGLIGHVSYDIAVFLNNLHWWQKGKLGIVDNLNDAVGRFAAAFEIERWEVREAAFAFMVIGAWWIFDEMPEHYENEVELADIWGISLTDS